MNAKSTTDKGVKRNAKASLFEHIFSDPKYLFALYQALHPEDTESTREDLRSVTLETILTTGLYNDLGFMVRNRLLILVEAQSTWTENIIIRSLLYLAQTYQQYFDELHQNMYTGRQLLLPEAELYVIYTGEKQLERQVITLSEEFFGGKQTAVEVRVNVITRRGEDDIISQYISFCQLYDEKMRTDGRNTDTLREILRICKERNILRDYLAEHEKEALDIMIDLFNKEVIQERWRLEERAEARAEGLAEGLAQGLETGLETGIRQATADFVARMLELGRFDYPEIAKLSGTTIEYVREVEGQLR